ncbi:hypothetical protein BEH_07625 [Priestia filamentosa]|uniref:Uncharacterized protein n=1 Tax=Priestia filamentosa TaxID=1402861 RepID=A0A0H4KI55_9BACI|nr:hypothetical protein [Priestia filamentosa]AKO91979.1 hypothetical protein BEH_07625 [Priestia filamentosa]
MYGIKYNQRDIQERLSYEINYKKTLEDKIALMQKDRLRVQNDETKTIIDGAIKDIENRMSKSVKYIELYSNLIEEFIIGKRKIASYYDIFK